MSNNCLLYEQVFWAGDAKLLFDRHSSFGNKHIELVKGVQETTWSILKSSDIFQDAEWTRIWELFIPEVGDTQGRSVIYPCSFLLLGENYSLDFITRTHLALPIGRLEVVNTILYPRKCILNLGNEYTRDESIKFTHYSILF